MTTNDNYPILKYTPECRCGSHLPRYPLHDAAGIFCCYICDECEQTQINRYNPEIFNSSSRYAISGEEEDLEIDYDP